MSNPVHTHIRWGRRRQRQRRGAECTTHMSLPHGGRQARNGQQQGRDERLYGVEHELQRTEACLPLPALTKSRHTPRRRPGHAPAALCESADFCFFLLWWSHTRKKKPNTLFVVWGSFRVGKLFRVCNTITKKKTNTFLQTVEHSLSSCPPLTCRAMGRPMSTIDSNPTSMITQCEILP